MIDANLELVAAVGFVRRDLHSAASAGSGYILQQAHRHGIETLRRNLEVGKNRAVGLRAATGSYGWHCAHCRRTQACAAAVLQDVGDGRIG